MAWKSTTWWHAGRAIAAAVAVALGCLAPLSSPAGAEGPDALFWELTQSAAQTYRMRLGAELPARRLPADWQASLGTEIGFAAAPLLASSLARKPRKTIVRTAGRPVAGSTVASCTCLKIVLFPAPIRACVCVCVCVCA